MVCYFLGSCSLVVNRVSTKKHTHKQNTKSGTYLTKKSYFVPVTETRISPEGTSNCELFSFIVRSSEPAENLQIEK